MTQAGRDTWRQAFRRHAEPAGLRLIAGLLLAGAATSAIVAWGCALVSPATRVANGHRLPLPPQETSRLYAAGWQRGDPQSIVSFNWSLGFGSARCTIWENWPATSRAWVLEEVSIRQRAGWPLHCLVGNAWRPHRQGGPATAWHGDGGFPLAGVPPRVLPWRPLWPGLLLDSVLYGAALGVLILVPRELIRLRRWRRHRCPTCGYPVGSSLRCPECGTVF